MNASQELVQILAQGPCSCYNANASAGWSIDSEGKTKSHYNPGPVTVCLRCKARKALAEDKVPFEESPRKFTVTL